MSFNNTAQKKPCLGQVVPGVRVQVLSEAQSLNSSMLLPLSNASQGIHQRKSCTHSIQLACDV
jgi:hypothetical protein